MNLLIVESPAKCSKIQGFLGSNYRVIASMGHIRSLVQDINSVGIQKNFEPTYEFMKEKAKTIANLKAAAKDATKVILCSDDDREGEAIAYSLAVLLKLDPKTNPRSAFREITSNAVLDAVSKPRVIDMNRVHSQQSRAMLDMMVGFTISPLLWKNLGGGAALSAGRCQTPALRLVCEREASIEKFTSELSWTIKGVWNGWPASMIDPLSDEESALNYLENHSNEKNATIHSAVTKPWTENPPLALMTSTLQQQVSNLYHCSPKRTMQIAQKLYEAGHITYMRTDQTTISEEAVLDARKVIESKWGKQYLGPVTPKKKAGAEAAVQAQEAHEAIRPTHFDLMKLPDSEDWGIQDHKVYKLIWLRAIQSVMSQAKGESREVIFNAEGDEGQLPWQAKWKRILFPGWKAADEKDTSISLANNGDDKDEVAVEEQEGDKAWKVAEALKPGQAIQWQQLKAEPKESKPQGRYTEASLVRDLEKRGIGRPSTFASLIATLVEKTYVEIKDIPSQVEKSRVHHLTAFGQWPPKSEEFSLKKGGEKARMCPSPLGKSVFEFTVKHFPDLFAYDFTANMEKRLDKIAEGKEAWKLVLSDTWTSYKDRYEEMKSATAVSGSGPNNRRREFPDIPGVIAVVTAKGPLLLKEGATKEDVVFYGWPADIKKGLQDITEAEVLSHIDKNTKQKQGDVLGEWNGHTIFKKKGPYGHYAEWNGVRVNMAEDDDLESISAKILAKQENPSRTLGPFQIKTGPYGPYLQKNGTGKASKPQYVSIPKETNIEQLTAQQAGEIFEAGLKAKAAFKKSKFKK